MQSFYHGFNRIYYKHISPTSHLFPRSIPISAVISTLYLEFTPQQRVLVPELCVLCQYLYVGGRAEATELLLFDNEESFD